MLSSQRIRTFQLTLPISLGRYASYPSTKSETCSTGVAVKPYLLLDGCRVSTTSPTVCRAISQLMIIALSQNRFVLRKKPAGRLLSSTAHQVEREFRMLNALHKHNANPTTTPDQIVPVPTPFVLCEDNSIIGTPFYIMEYLEGRIFTHPTMLGVAPEIRREW